jgi:ferrous-iron efflux pump FieF
MPVPSVKSNFDHVPKREAGLKNSAARLSILAATFLFLIKTGTGWLTGSIAVWASLLDSAMDIFASTINYYAVRAAARPPDEDHAYGHGKAESLAGLFQALIITISGLFLIREAIRRLIFPQPTRSETIGVATMLVTLVVSAALVARLRRVARGNRFTRPECGRRAFRLRRVYHRRGARRAASHLFYQLANR